MVVTLGKRRLEAVQALEALQQSERAQAGESWLTPEDFHRKLKENIHQQIISDRLDPLGGDEIEAIITGHSSEQAKKKYAEIIAARGDSSEQAEKKYAEMLQVWHLDDPTQWSRYEMPNICYDLARICGSIEAVFARCNRPLSEFPVVGTLTTGQESAITQPTSTGSPLILIDNGFFKFATIMSRLAIFAPYDARYKGEFSWATVQFVADLAATHTVLNTCLYTYPRKVPEQFQSRVENFQWSVAMFVIAHEYAHISAGDYNAHPSKPGERDASRHAKELRADKTGFTTTVEALREINGAEYSVFGPFLYLAGLDLLARAAAAYEGQPRPALTDPEYPTPFERIMSLLEWLETTDYGGEFRAQIREASECYNAILFVWDRILPTFLAARNELSAFDPSKVGGVVEAYPLEEARVFGLVQTLSQRLRANLGYSG
jgi:hypothetical protein